MKHVFVSSIQRKLRRVIPTDIFYLICILFRYDFGIIQHGFIQDKCEGVWLNGKDSLATLEDESYATYNIPIYIDSILLQRKSILKQFKHFLYASLRTTHRVVAILL